MTADLITVAAPGINIDISKADKKQLKFLERQRLSHDQMEIIGKGLDIIKPVITHELFLVLAAFAAGNWMLANYETQRAKGLPPKFPYLEPYEATILGYGIIAIAIAKAGVLEGAGEVLSKIQSKV